jgi:PAS domain S-box-containing protein
LKPLDSAFPGGDPLFRSLLESAPDAIVIVNMAGLIVLVNSQTEALFGYPREELLGQPVETLVPERFRQHHRGLRDGYVVEPRVRAMGPGLDLFGRRKNGEEFPVEISLSPLTTDHETFVSSSIRDVTNRMQLNRAAQRLAAIVESSNDAIVGMNLDGVITSWNRAAERMFGYSAAEAIGQSITLIIPPDRRDEETLVLARVRAGESVEIETLRQHKDGTSVPISLMVSPVKDARGHIVGASKIARDITERKKAKAALGRLSGRLSRLEGEERRRLSRELHDSTAQRLAALCMNLSVAKEAAGALESRAQRALDESAVLADLCLREVRTASYLLHPPELDEFGLQSALARYIDGFIQRSGICVEADVAPDLGRLPQAVETAVFRIVQECLTNIHRHSGSRTAHMRLSRGPSELVLEVRDAGTGVRGNAPPGVGIASMEERLQQFGASLEINSRPGGTIVRAVIPL